MIESISFRCRKRIAWIPPEREIASAIGLLGTVVEVSVSELLTSSGRSGDWTPVDWIGGDR